MKVSVVVFPGSNCDHDVIHLYENILGCTVNAIWHRDRDLKDPDLIVLPGGFSYGDYLRAGVLAKVSPVMGEVVQFSQRGGAVLGICNGFQILCEAGLLPGVLLQNAQRRFLSRQVHIRVDSNSSAFTRDKVLGEIMGCPIAHFEGNFFVDPETKEQLEKRGQIVFRYCDHDGEVDPTNFRTNPNGSLDAIAGVCNEKGNVLGLMPHPERAAESLVGGIAGQEGLNFFMPFVDQGRDAGRKLTSVAQDPEVQVVVE